MRFADYDHDGKATEFVFQVGNTALREEDERANWGLREQSTVARVRRRRLPDKPLILQASHWEALLGAKTPVKVVDWKCWDHGSDRETELQLSADKKTVFMSQARNMNATRTEAAENLLRKKGCEEKEIIRRKTLLQNPVRLAGLKPPFRKLLYGRGNAKGEIKSCRLYVGTDIWS